MAYFDDRTGILPMPQTGGGGLMGGEYGDLMRQAKQRQLFNAMSQIGGGLMQAGMGGPWGSQRQGIANAFKGLSQQTDPMDLIRARYMMGQIEDQKSARAVEQAQIEARSRVAAKLSAGASMEDLRGDPDLVAAYPEKSFGYLTDETPAQKMSRDVETERLKSGIPARAMDPGEWNRRQGVKSKDAAGLARLRADLAKQKPSSFQEKVDYYKANNPGASDMEAANWARTTRTEDITDTPLELDELRAYNVPAGTTWGEIRGTPTPPEGVSVPPGGPPAAGPSPIPPGLAPPPPMPGAPQVPGAPVPPPMPGGALGPQRSMEDIAAGATGLKSNVRSSIDNFLGGVFGAEEAWPENSKARAELGNFVTDARTMIAKAVDDGRMAVQEQEWAEKNLPLPDQIGISPGKSAELIAQARDRWEHGIVLNNASLQRPISDDERQRLMDQNETYRRVLARMGPAPEPGTRENPLKGVSEAKSQNLPPNTVYEGEDGNLYVTE